MHYVVKVEEIAQFKNALYACHPSENEDVTANQR